MFCSTPDVFAFSARNFAICAQLVVFPAAEVHAVDEQPLVAKLLAERAVDDVLQRLQPLAAPREQRFRAVAREIDARAIGRRLDLRLETEAHVLHDLRHEVDDLLLCVHIESFLRFYVFTFDFLAL